MVQFKVLSGKQAGAVVATTRLPFVVGRNSAANLRLEEEGVWDRHLELNLHLPEGFLLTVQPNARATVNEQPVQDAILRNADLIAMGPVKIQFWLSETRQSGLRSREWLTWAGLAALCAGPL